MATFEWPFLIDTQTMKLISFLLLCTILLGCSKKRAEEQAKVDDQVIQSYLSTHQLTATKLASGLYYRIENQGSGVGCNTNSTVRVAYKGYLTTGEVFDESDANGITFNLQQVIPGWTEGIPQFKVGGNGQLFIPSALAYGKNGTQGIPPNTVLIFDITLKEVL
jgi:FKBP-type peptidyl-prolyl cis-trans isomerase FkpA